MNKTIVVLSLAGVLCACASVAPPPSIEPGALVGTWAVDLRPSPDAPAYVKEFVVHKVSGKTFEGSFYDSPITEGRINATWGTLRIAFVTSDGVGPYHHSAVLRGAQLEGLSNVPHRGFLAYWSAVKKK